MRPIHSALLLLAAIPSLAAARPWQNIQPGRSTRAEVVARFGEPSTQGKLGSRTALVYKGDQAIAGTRQAQFFLRDDGVVSEVTVFPATRLDQESVEGTYGKGAQKTFTDDFRPVWLYRAIGIAVFFGKDGNVDAITFKAPEAAHPPPERHAPEPRSTGPESAAPAH
jgi:hypothetical protein